MTSRVHHTSTSPQYFTVDEVAARWKVSPKKVRREISREALVAHRFGRQLRISEADLLVYERQRRQS